MKNIFYILGCVSCLLLVGCKMELNPYDEKENRLDFVYERGTWADADADSTVNYSFAYLPEGIKNDTVWLKVRTIGYVTDYDRPFVLEQIPSGGMDAEAAKHYVTFNDPELAKRYVIPANQVSAKVPIVLKRDPSLETKAFRLKVSIVGNEHFEVGEEKYLTKVITFSDILLPLKLWAVEEDRNILYYLGEYGPVKHRFMIEATADMGVVINDAFIEELFGDPYSMDIGLINYWSGFFKKKLKEENERLGSEGPLREEPLPGEDVGKIVSFGY